MSGKLIFNFNITAAQSAEGNEIKFGSEFYNLQVTFGAPHTEMVTLVVESVQSVPVQINVEGRSAAAPAAAKPSVFTRLTYPQPAAMAKGKSPVVADSPAFGNFELGSSSAIPEITKSQRRNMIRRMRRRVKRAEASKNTPVVAAAEASKNMIHEFTEVFFNSPQLAGTKKRVQFQEAGPSRPATTSNRCRELKSLPSRDQYQNSSYQDSQQTPIKSLGYAALARRGYNPISSPSPRHSGNRPLRIYDNPPIRHPSRADSHRHQGSESTSGFDRRRLKFPNQSSSLYNLERIWRPKMTPTPTALMKLKKDVAEQKSRKGKSIMEPSPSREYTPVDPHDVGGKIIEEMVNHLKESIRYIDEEEAGEEENMDQEMSGSVNIIDTHSSLQREKEKGKEKEGLAEAKDDEDDTTDSTHRLLEQLITYEQKENKAPIIEPKGAQADQAPIVPEKEQKKEAKLSSDKLVISTNWVQVTREDNSDLSTMERLKKYVKNITLTPLSQSDVKRLEVNASLPLNPETKANNVIPSTRKTTRDRCNLDDPFMDEIIELPFDWYSNSANRFAKQGLTPLKWTRGEAQQFEHMWNRIYHKQFSKYGIDFATLCSFDDDEYCCGSPKGFCSWDSNAKGTITLSRRTKSS
ncbi:hypothetical protein MA16_Dca015881 [Dendrobium catenatum]|uniref:Uncharacterized protein n=1 Tax=Dendrobium catenatum TaxID=906689 RepID=A0A2I0VMI8_9ASPA|nr:hypothetical protein MA16_Dca015881 [Dendrobium catenatum]